MSQQRILVPPKAFHSKCHHRQLAIQSSSMSEAAHVSQETRYNEGSNLPTAVTATLSAFSLSPTATFATSNATTYAIRWTAANLQTSGSICLALSLPS